MPADVSRQQFPPAPRLLVRPGARFVCHADGLCCSDVHALGPVTPPETVPLQRLMKDPVTTEPAVGGLGLRIAAGGCVFLRSDNLCRVHAELGVDAKPATCRRYPFNLVATPRGLRVATPHRCPCRTLGARPLLTEADVNREINIQGTPLEPDHRVGDSVRWARGQRLSFDAWCERESVMLRHLAQQDAVGDVLQAPPFAELEGASWPRVAASLQTPMDATAFEVAKQWLAHAIWAQVQQRPWPTLPRPWARFFDAAEKRIEPQQSADALFADWMADEIWSLQWTLFGSFARGRYDLATRLALARILADRLGAVGLVPVRAAAEALMIVDVITHAQHWYPVVRALKVA